METTGCACANPAGAHAPRSIIIGSILSGLGMVPSIIDVWGSFVHLLLPLLGCRHPECSEGATIYQGSLNRVVVKATYLTILDYSAGADQVERTTPRTI